MANEMTPTIAISAMSCLSCFSDWKKAWKKPVGLRENEQILQTFYVCIYTEWKKKTQNSKYFRSMNKYYCITLLENCIFSTTQFPRVINGKNDK